MITHKGFTLIELMIVVSIIGVLASISLPSYKVYVQRSEVTEAISMASTIKENIAEYYVTKLSFPLNNNRARVPEEDKLIGNRVTGVLVENGAIHVTMGNKASPSLQGKILTFRPATVNGSPQSPIAWLCGNDEAVNGMTAIGTNKTTIDDTYLPSACSNS